MNKKILGYLLLIMGALLFVGGTTRLVTVVMDNTSPTFMFTVPADGETYSALDWLDAQVVDAESGVKSVTCTLDSTFYELTQSISLWSKFIGSVSGGSHSFTFEATDNNGWITQVSGTFEIYTGLQGKWYINDIEITEPTQVIRSTTYTLTFKFVKTTGIDDSQITCKAEWTGPETWHKQLTNTAPSTWIGSYTFTTGGSYTMTLIADDETKQVTMSIWDFNIGKEPFAWEPFAWQLHPAELQLLGLAMMAIGAVIAYRSRKAEEDES